MVLPTVREDGVRVPDPLWVQVQATLPMVALWPTVFRLTPLRFAGVPFRLLKWQEIIVRLLVGWKAPIEIIDPETHLPSQVHVRLFRELRLWVPRGGAGRTGDERRGDGTGSGQRRVSHHPPLAQHQRQVAELAHQFL